MTMELNDQVALITGGTAGIGRAIAELFAKNGAVVAIIGQNTERGKEVEALLQHDSPNSRFWRCDVSSYSEAQRVSSEVADAFGPIDLLINNAGITRDSLFMKMAEEDWDTVMAVNAKSCFNFCHSVVRPMVKRRSGKIINIGSIVGLTGNAGQVNYAASKAAIIGLTKALAKELASRGICVNCIAPGFIKTAMSEALDEKQIEAIVAQIPMRRMGLPEEIAQLALFLASSRANYITGQVYRVDGGLAN